MIKFSESLTSDMQLQLSLIHAETTCPVQYSRMAIKVLIPMLERLKTFFMQYQLKHKTEEIIFFREIKPRFASNLIYYNEVYNIATAKPPTSKRQTRKYYVGELKKLDHFFNDNSDFYRYYTAGSNYLDKKYFIRGKHDVSLTLDSFYLQADHRFSTSHDYKVARLLANYRIRKYLEGELSALNDSTDATVTPPQKTINWTGSKVALVELIYALHTEGVFNHGKSDLRALATTFETLFDIQLGQYHRTFLEIRERKSDRTKFLSQLKDNLIARMDQVDDRD